MLVGGSVFEGESIPGKMVLTCRFCSFFLERMKAMT